MIGSTQARGSGRKPTRRRQAGWLSFLAGLGLGLLIAFVVYLEFLVPRMPEGGLASPRPGPPDARPEGAPVASTKPRFDFYAILPDEEVKVPEWELRAPARAPEPPRQTPRPAGPYVIQVASFQRHDEAERVRARLALIGITATIQRVVINGKDVWFRVRIGPFGDADAMEGTRARLAEHSINSMLVRLKPGQRE